jgi:hypothetical protein
MVVRYNHHHHQSVRQIAKLYVQPSRNFADPPLCCGLFRSKLRAQTGARPSVRLCAVVITALLGHRNTATTKKLYFKNSHLTSVGATVVKVPGTPAESPFCFEFFWVSIHFKKNARIDSRIA